MSTHSDLLLDMKQHHSPSNTLLEFTHFGYMWTSVNTKKITASHSIYNLLELEPYTELLTVQRWRQFVHPKDLYKLIQAEEMVMLTGKQCSTEYRIITRNRKYIYVNHIMQLSPWRDNDFKIMSILDDITEQKSAEIILEVMNESFFELDKNFVFRRVNERAENHWGVQRTSLLNNCIWDVFPQYADSEYQKLTINAKDGNRVISDVMCPVTREWVHLSASPYNDGVIVVFYNIHNEKEAEVKIKEQAHFIQKINEGLADILSIMVIETKEIIYSNYSVAKILGYTEEAIERMQNPFLDIMYPSDVPAIIAHVDAMKDASDTEVREIEYRMIDATGIIWWFRDRNTVFKRDENGKAIEKTCIAQDITHKKKANEKIKELNDSLLHKNRQLASLNTELNTFSTVAASNYTETLRQLYIYLESVVTNDARNLSNAGRANVRRAQAAIQKMKLLTDDLRSYMLLKEIDLRKEKVDLNVIIKNILGDFDEQLEKFSIIFICKQLDQVTGYPFLISLLFHNLIDNAIKFRKADKAHEISVSCRQHVPGLAISHKDAVENVQYHEITISDNGIGIPAEEIENIFGIFYRIHEKKLKGSGVGLAISKKIMDMHDGFITAESTQGAGASFHCYFPE